MQNKTLFTHIVDLSGNYVHDNFVALILKLDQIGLKQKELDLEFWSVRYNNKTNKLEPIQLLETLHEHEIDDLIDGLTKAKKLLRPKAKTKRKQTK